MEHATQITGSAEVVKHDTEVVFKEAQKNGEDGDEADDEKSLSEDSGVFKEPNVAATIEDQNDQGALEVEDVGSDEEEQEEDVDAQIQLMKDMMERSKKLQAARLRVRDNLLKKEEQARKAAELQSREEEVFKANAVDFYELIKKTMYLNRDMDSQNPNAFYISDAPLGKRGELMVYNQNNRMIIRPWNNADCVLSMPGIGNHKQHLLMKQSRRGGPLVPASSLNDNTQKGSRQEAPFELKKRQGRVVKKSFIIGKKLKVSRRPAHLMRQGTPIPGTTKKKRYSKRGPRAGSL